MKFRLMIWHHRRVLWKRMPNPIWIVNTKPDGWAEANPILITTNVKAAVAWKNVYSKTWSGLAFLCWPGLDWPNFWPHNWPGLKFLSGLRFWPGLQCLPGLKFGFYQNCWPQFVLFFLCKIDDLIEFLLIYIQCILNIPLGVFSVL